VQKLNWEPARGHREPRGHREGYKNQSFAFGCLVLDFRTDDTLATRVVERGRGSKNLYHVQDCQPPTSMA
jgi:hypothetical protein